MRELEPLTADPSTAIMSRRIKARSYTRFLEFLMEQTECQETIDHGRCLTSAQKSIRDQAVLPGGDTVLYMRCLSPVGERYTIPLAKVQVRYIVSDVDAAIAFYCKLLGFREIMHPAPPFAMLERGDLRLVLSKPNPSGGGGQPMPDGTQQAPGGWNRFSIEVVDLDAKVAELRGAKARFRNDIVVGVGGRQILVEDPSGNPIELFEPTVPEARLDQGPT